jgi:hypothetical protein
VPSSDTQLCADNSDVKQSTFQCTNSRDLQPIYIEDVKERNRLTSGAFCIVNSRLMTRDSENLSNGAIALYTTASMARTTLVANLHNVIPSIEPMTPKRTLSLVSLRGATPQG